MKTYRRTRKKGGRGESRVGRAYDGREAIEERKAVLGTLKLASEGDEEVS